MALKGNLETVVELKSSPDKFLSVWKSQAHQVPNHTPINIQGVHVHEGDWVKSGSIKIWKYTIAGRSEVFKDKIIVDDEKKTLTGIGLEGDVFKSYKVFNLIWQLTPKDEGSLAKVIIEYEKLNENVPTPDIYLDFIIKITTDVDESISKN
ncbi:MLP-like protein 43 [Manihot esculenta]|uniref:Bet v I/Major latex protein domain-containing protein n=1 Tax=Manihot esculenta TaxID=3983 RepID=A0A2C9UFR6_MANES|nr:MLP-like protein 43 [Manihot esculenta]OAY29248.1 hypothetical protein MANES_15G129800v8 [Manihot esculenta]